MTPAKLSKAGWTSRLLANRRRALLAGTVGLAIVGMAAANGSLVPQVTPAYAQATAETAQPMAAAPFSFADVVERVRPAVVSVRVKSEAKVEQGMLDGNPFFPNLPDDHPFGGLEEFFKRFGQESPFGDRRQFSPPGHGPQRIAQGSGFFISADGYAVTNNHVVDGAEEVSIVMDDGTTLDAKVIGTDDKTDLALLKVDADRTFAFVPFAEADVRIGDWVVAVGNPFGLGGTVTAGIVSARGRDLGSGPYDDYIQIDAPINKGNSGGPTFNYKGEVVGVNTAIYSPSGGSVGIGFAIPAKIAEQVVADLKDNGTVVRGWLGVLIQPVTEDIADGLGLKEAKGALVTEPQEDSPAAKAGLKSGDAILTVNGGEVKDSKDLARRIAAFSPGSSVALEIWRNGAKETVNVTLGTYPGSEGKVAASDGGQETGTTTKLGLALAPAAEVGAGDKGVAITEIDPDGPAAEKGLNTGDVIVEVAGTAVSSPKEVSDAVDAAKSAGKTTVLMRLETKNGPRFVAISLAKS